MTDQNQPATDLLGDPWQEPKDARGRKRHKRLPQVAETIAVLRASGLSAAQIALRVNLSEPTLRKYYFRELEDGAVLANAVLNEAMWKKAKSGNVSAANYIRAQFDSGKVKRIAEAEQPSRPVKEPAVGKKQQMQDAAKNVSGLYATPAPPKLAVDNTR